MLRPPLPSFNFSKHGLNPILTPSDAPFESKGVYNPTVIINNGVFYMLYRAEGEGTGTGVVALACSKDGVSFRGRRPVIFPDRDYDAYGCEDPRVVKIRNLFYLTYNGNDGGRTAGNICLATSSDLLRWNKVGEILQPKEGSWNEGQVKSGAIVPGAVNGIYFMYFQGEREPWRGYIGVARSKDLIRWEEAIERPVLSPRPERFDSMGVEPGAAVLVREGILLIYNGWDEEKVHRVGWALFSSADPTRLVARCEEPLLEPTEGWEGRITFAESLIYYNNYWYLYYGAADKFIALAISK